jgi:hypothetical protein
LANCSSFLHHFHKTIIKIICTHEISPFPKSEASFSHNLVGEQNQVVPETEGSSAGGDGVETMTNDVSFAKMYIETNPDLDYSVICFL